MSFFRRASALLCVCPFLFSPAWAQSASRQLSAPPQVQVRPRGRIVLKIDNTHLASLPHTYPARITGLVHAGRLAPSTPLKNLWLVLKSSDEQEHALQTLLDQQQDKAHSNFHHWISPTSFGAAFGVADTDISQVKTWLEAAGLTVDRIAKGGRLLQFSGTAGEVETAFHTEMHQYLVNGETRISNATDISIPQALAPVIAGVSSLNNFRPTHSLHALKVAMNARGEVTSATAFAPSTDTSVSGNAAFPSGHFVGGADLAVLYNTAPLLAAGINGKGGTIGIIGQADVLLSDVQMYRKLFGLPANDFHRIQVGSDPGTTADDGESDLDLELAGAMAPNATINFYTSGEGYFGGGIDSAMEYVIENNDADIISLSYGECEQNLGAGGNEFYNIIYEQAAAQGQSIFVSTGDSGPDLCDAGSTYAKSGYSVNGLGSTPYNVAVGGTQFNEGSSYNTVGATPFWSAINRTTVPFVSALGYIPEQPWNESAFGTATIGGLLAAGSGVSFYYATPSYQNGPGIPSSDPLPPAGSSIAALPSASFMVPGPHRYVPDVSLNASVYHDGTIFCAQGSCTQTITGGLSSFGIVGGTSVGAPVMAGAQALINQANGGRQGVPNYVYYRLAAAQSQSACSATGYTASAGCAFHDVQTGNTDVPSNTLATTEIGWGAGPQYDLAVGLGSPDVAHLASSWPSANFHATTTSFHLTPTTSAHGTPVNVTVDVSPMSGTGTPTGNVAIIAQALNGSVGFYTLSNAAVNNGSLRGLPAGTYNVYARYAGDTNFAASTSAPVQVTVSTESSIVAAASYLLDANGALTPRSSFTYGSNIFLSAGVTAPSGTGVPTGPITFTLNNGTANLAPFVMQLDPNGAGVDAAYYGAGAYFDSGVGFAAHNIQPTFPVLSPGTYAATIAYAGDTTFLASTLATPLLFTVGKAATNLTVNASATTINSGDALTLTAAIETLAASAGGVPATGLVTFTDASTGIALGSATLTAGSLSLTTTSLVASGIHTITAVYAGDANYASQSASINITVNGAPIAVQLVVGPSAPRVLTPVTMTATLPHGTSGTVSFFDANVSIGTASISQITFTAVLVVNTLTAGTHSLTAVYQGSSAVAAVSSPIVALSVLQNLPSLSLSSPQSNAAGAPFTAQATLTLAPSNGASVAAIPPTGMLQFFDQQSPSSAVAVLGTSMMAYSPGGASNYIASLSASALKPGHHVLSASYAGDTNYAAASSNPQSVDVGLTSLTASSSTAGVGTNIPFTLTAIVTPLVTTATPIAGSVIFYDGAAGMGAVIGTATVSAGTATLTSATLTTPGTHHVTAMYSGDANFFTSTFSTGVSITATSPGFTVTANPSTLTLKAGSSASIAITATNVGNYSGSVSLSCAGLPAFTTCSFLYPAGTLAKAFLFDGTNGLQQGTMVITTVAPAGPNTQPAALLWLPGLALSCLLVLRRKSIPARGRHLVASAMLACLAMAVTGCGSGMSIATQAGVYNVSVVVHGVGSTAADPTVQTSLPITLVVK